ncbi:MAG: hypothetical protein IAI50_04785 [Candidatus Eremiobacteraeota bacterium]|nr:hypothetical protein [Candidatus Eremiobacteraeota bacterium]
MVFAIPVVGVLAVDVAVGLGVVVGELDATPVPGTAAEDALSDPPPLQPAATKRIAKPANRFNM